MKLMLFSLTMILCLPVFSQSDETLLDNPRFAFTGVWAGSSARVIHFNELGHFGSGAFIGFEFNKNYLIGWEGYAVNAFTEYNGDLDIRSNAFLFGYTKTAYKFIHPVAYLSVGECWSSTTGHETLRSMALHGALGLEFNIFSWMRAGGEIGYRYISSNGENWIRQEKLSAPFASLRLKFGYSWGK